MNLTDETCNCLHYIPECKALLLLRPLLTLLLTTHNTGLLLTLSYISALSGCISTIYLEFLSLTMSPPYVSYGLTIIRNKYNLQIIEPLIKNSQKICLISLSLSLSLSLCIYIYIYIYISAVSQSFFFSTAIYKAFFIFSTRLIVIIQDYCIIQSLLHCTTAYIQPPFWGINMAARCRQSVFHSPVNGDVMFEYVTVVDVALMQLQNYATNKNRIMTTRINMHLFLFRFCWCKYTRIYMDTL